MSAIHEGIERDGLESRLANMMEVKKAHKLTDEVGHGYNMFRV